MGNIIEVLKNRFECNMDRHHGMSWGDVEEKLKSNDERLKSLEKMENTGGEPDVVGYDSNTKEYIFMDCSLESPVGRRGLCYDLGGQNERKDGSCKGNVIDTAKKMGIEVLDEQQYVELQKLGDFDRKTSSWLKTSDDVRKLGGAIFGDYRYRRTFVYHNGAQSYYSSRGFRGVLRV